MTAKDSSLFEARKHNFNVLLSDDEETNVVEKKETEAVPAVKAPVVAADASADDDGFETFVSAKNKPKKPSTGQYQSNKPRPASGHKPFPKELIIPKPETSIEFYDFASTLRTGDLRKLLQAHDGHYRLKWNHDTSCFVVFDNPALVEVALNELANNDQVKVRLFDEANVVVAAPAATETAEAAATEAQ